jgi:Domain of Unknown Function (DUF1080)
LGVKNIGERNQRNKRQNDTIMKTKTVRLAVLLIIILSVIMNIAIAQAKTQIRKKSEVTENKTILFNGKDLNNWVFKLKDPSIDPATVFTIRNGLIHISGNPFGYMRTKDIYSDYKLHVEWRWPTEATNSGVFVHAKEPDSIWLKCIECQLQAGNAGDFVCMNGADMTERTDKSKPFVKKLAASSEKPTGEWNAMEVVCEGNTIKVTVNGILQNKGTNVSVTKGSICLQSEGKDVEFRNVYLEKLEK